LSNVAVKKDPYRWVVILFIFLFYFVVLGFTNQSFNVLLATMAKDLKWTGVQTTAIATAMFSGMIWFVFRCRCYFGQI
jgi:fucose permease